MKRLHTVWASIRRRWLLGLVWAVCHLTLCPAFAQVGTWRNYLSYQEPQQICAAGTTDLFVLASGALYQYNLGDHSITTYDKVNGMTGANIACIAWNQKARRLIAVYENSNIDLVDIQGNVTNISALYSKTMTQDKTVNSLYTYNEYCYLSMGFGIVKVNTARAEIAETYMLGTSIVSVGISGGRIYAQATNGTVLGASLTDNLLNNANWTVTTSVPANVFTRDNSDWDNYRDLVATLAPGGPKYNRFGAMRCVGKRLYTVTRSDLYLESKGCVQVLGEDRSWDIYQDNLDTITGHRFVGLYSVDVDPTDDTHVTVTSQAGIYEFSNGKFLKEHNNDNSPLLTASTVGGGNKDYVIVVGGKYDANGNFWCLNSISPSTSLLCLERGGGWQQYHHPELMQYDDRSLEQMEQMMFDSRGLMWFVNNFSRTPALIRYNRQTDEVKVYKSVVNQDGIQYSPTAVHCVAEDADGNIWAGTTVGLFMLPAASVATSDETMQQIKVPRNDGTDYADYLMNGVDITTMAIDGGNRKWIGTNGNGVYLISADNMTQIHHFTTENSGLLSDNIECICIYEPTGEVFIGTEQGLCSYYSDATQPSLTMEKNSVYAYPNPVTPDFTGLITVTGLTADADVKICTSSGKLVAEGRSNGGSFTWDGTDKVGRRVASGVYTVLTATADGKKGTACKIAIIR